jgi:hypothetical protein
VPHSRPARRVRELAALGRSADHDEGERRSTHESRTVIVVGEESSGTISARACKAKRLITERMTHFHDRTKYGIAEQGCPAQV